MSQTSYQREYELCQEFSLRNLHFVLSGRCQVTCHLCGVILGEAVKLPCLHRFCLTCFDLLMSKSYSQCPMDSMPFSPGSVTVSRYGSFLQRQVCCRNRGSGCNFETNMSSLRCHEAECFYFKAECGSCGEEFTARQLQSHVRHGCPMDALKTTEKAVSSLKEDFTRMKTAVADELDGFRHELTKSLERLHLLKDSMSCESVSSSSNADHTSCASSVATNENRSLSVICNSGNSLQRSTASSRSGDFVSEQDNTSDFLSFGSDIPSSGLDWNLRLLIPSRRMNDIIGKLKTLEHFEFYVTTAESHPDTVVELRVLRNEYEAVMRRLFEVFPGPFAIARMLVDCSQIPVVIGKQGCSIKSLNQGRECRVNVHNKTCPFSTEQVVEFTGSKGLVISRMLTVMELCERVPEEWNRLKYVPGARQRPFIRKMYSAWKYM